MWRIVKLSIVHIKTNYPQDWICTIPANKELKKDMVKKKKLKTFKEIREKHDDGRDPDSWIAIDPIDDVDPMAEALTPLMAEASKCVNVDRINQYGEPEECFVRIADLWNAFFGDQLQEPISPRQVCRCMQLLKIARDYHAPKFDNGVDIVGYELCIERGEMT